MRAVRVGIVLVLLGPAAPSARAGYADFVGVRPLGIGGALRGAATGDAAPMLNPSGISLLKLYVVEAAYQHLRPASGNAFHGSIVDSTSGFNIGGALYYTYSWSSPAGVDAKTHEGGFALSIPFGDRFYLGGTLKYVWDRLSGAPEGSLTSKGFTFDAGLTVRPVQPVTVAFVGYNLSDVGTPRAPRSIGWGATVSPRTELLLAFDGVLDFTDADPNRGNVLTLMGGAEYVFAQRAALRAGGGRDGLRQGAFVTVGVSLLAEVGALDAGFRQDVSGRERATFIGASARLFVPAP
jgi:hypothetical protein